jgi:hypothetical protein
LIQPNKKVWRVGLDQKVWRVGLDEKV